MGLGKRDAKEVMKEIKELECTWENRFVNAPAKGSTWNSLALKQELKDRIKVHIKPFTNH